MNRTKSQNRSDPVSCSGGTTIRLTAAALLAALLTAQAQDLYQPPQAVPGGLDAHPYIKSVTKGTNGLKVDIQGVQGPFQLQSASSLPSSNWRTVGSQVGAGSVTVPMTGGDLGILRVANGNPNYVGAAQCKLCHRTGEHPTYNAWTNTAHYGAFETLRAAGQHTNTYCLVCHTVGYGYATGFKDEATTPQFEGVQCENCHGPGGAHADDPSLTVPIVTPAAEICGGCHNGFHHPSYDEWSTSPHAEVVPDVASGFPTGGSGRMMQCGPCHSGAVRLALLEGVRSGSAPELPSGDDAAAFGVTCSVCHSAHPTNAFTAQLRNPTASTNNFSYVTSTNLASFAQQYKPDVMICGQCHNMRGAIWNDSGSRPPHHSPQYNMLVGQGAYDLGTSKITSHGNPYDNGLTTLANTNQCAHCHTRQFPSPNPSLTNPNYQGHTFEVHFEACLDCHEGSTAEDIASSAELVQADFRTRINEVKGLLDNWATNKAPADLQKYGALAWEYNNAGPLSNPTGSSSIKGPSTTATNSAGIKEQNLIPDGIKQARFNLYLVDLDGSFGIHNYLYAANLLRVATANVNTELAKP